MNAHFVAKSGDAQAEQALEVLKANGYSVDLIPPGGAAEPGSVAIFTPARVPTGSRGKYLRCSATRLAGAPTPPWAETTPFRVGVMRCQRQFQSRGKTKGSFAVAVLGMAQEYVKWTPQNGGRLVPWGPYETDPTITPDSPCAVRTKEWLAWAAEAYAKNGNGRARTSPDMILAIHANRPKSPSRPFPEAPVDLVTFFCPNVTADRSAFTTDLVPEKVAAFEQCVEAMLHGLGNNLRKVRFHALDTQILDWPKVLPLLHRRILEQGGSTLRENLARNWSAFSKVVDGLKQKFPGKVELNSMVEFLAPHMESAEAELESCGLAVDDLVEEFRRTTPHYASFSTSEARERVRAELILYLSTSRAVAVEGRTVLLGVEVSDKYWNALWPYLQGQGCAPHLFWLPVNRRQHFSF